MLLGAVWTVVKLRERRLLVRELDMRNRLFSIISHDLRNPVAGNRMLARELIEQVDTLSAEQLKDALTMISKSADTASALLENLLLWSLNQEGMLRPVLRDENMLELAKEAADSVRGDIAIEMDVQPDLSIRTDRNMLLTVLRNLLDNAIKASPAGGTVTLRAHGRRIVIADEGPGLRETDTLWGHGLGLVITRELLDKLGAAIRMDNRPEGGLEITIDL